ncbi:acyl-homoserine-lactone synthase [Sphingomonas sp. CJ20]
MLLLLDTAAGPVSDIALRSMFAARKSVFVDLLNWQLPVLAGKYELDQFDNAQARYLILTDARYEHLASARLLPTTRPHILDSLFPALCADAPPRGRDIWEITRFCLDRTLRAPERRAARNRLVTAIVEHALGNGIRKYTGVAEIGWLQQILSFGWTCRPLGLPAPDGRTMLGALEIEIDAETPGLLAAGGVWCADVLPLPRSPQAAVA